MEKVKKSTIIWICLLFLAALILGASLGFGLSETQNMKNSEYIESFYTALPTKLLDINGELITEFASDEKREIISLNKLPQHMIDALLTREDRIFYSHRGFSFKAVFRAVIGKLTRRSLGGGSTLTQQIAGTLYCDRAEMSIMRKIRELWYAIQMERRYSKNEILELYLNRIYFGGGTYGVNAASKYYFGHSAEEITPAEAAILVIQLSNPAFYNPFDHPNRAMDRQKNVLDSMVAAGYITQEESDESFDDFWAAFDYTRTSSSAYMIRDDKAPWFSEYVRRELGNLIYGSQSIYTAGFTVNTTLNLKNQQIAQDIMEKYIAEGNRRYQKEHESRSAMAFSTYIPMTELLALTFNIPAIKVSEQRAETISNATYLNQINPILDVFSMMTGIDTVKISIVNRANVKTKKENERTTVEGTMISLENDTGYITALVGGSKFDQENQFIRATQAKLQPGSVFKPLYYTEAINSRKFTSTTIISDTPVVFHTADGKPYIPQNFRGEWLGNVPLYYALTHSMNVPSLKVLDEIGFDAAISRSVSLLGISKDDLPSRGFVPGYPLGLGVCSVRPIEIARAYAVIASGGKAVTPMAIRTVEDRNGNIILNPEREIRESQQAKGEASQVISPQTAFIMTKLLEQTVRSGTLSAQSWKLTYRTEKGARYEMPAAGKTGTTQNWADAWTSGYTPYYTATFWFGFDRPGQSLGLHITGATLAGYAWGDYMREVHRNMIPKDFPKPAEGVIQAAVCSTSGMIPTPSCEGHITRQWYLLGTQPTNICTVHSSNSMSSLSISRLQSELYQSGQHLTETIDTTPLSLHLDFLNADYEESQQDEILVQNKIENSESTGGNLDEDSTLNYNYLME
ncbi:MAG: PBP1A family penicillin-binding protein [Treponema sp.]|nr:PBP1A family penicillin-binding protein [Treponema sp.]MBD5404818.1 PBP1A family penicillin-binding protein [Treponema sp.]MBD5412080.1 PBP1A family penicillin-binding protein [Treponema sp.]MBD5414525.1 PBP1A family penicillin-binding protein [Treponema sp.]